MHSEILSAVEDAIRSVTLLKSEEALTFMSEVVTQIAGCFLRGNKILIAGNGGSLCDAMHFAEELTGFYREKRAPFPAIAFSDPGHMSCVANDTHFDEVYARLIQALGQKGDIFIALTTSGRSKNIIQASLEAKKKDLTVISFLGKTGGEMTKLSDLFFIVPGFIYSDRIQEAHMTMIHIIIEMVEKEMARSNMYALTH